MKISQKKVAVIMGSVSDLPIVSKTIKKLEDFDIEVVSHVISAHRTPNIAQKFASNAQNNDIGVIIAAAGKAAHLAGVIAAYTTLPVIGLPIKSSTLDGLDSLLSTVQMPSGVPVATVAIDGAENAAILAIQILAIYNNDLTDKLLSMKTNMEKAILTANENLDVL